MQALAGAGLDIAHAFDARALVRELPWLAGARRGVLIGNTRAVWPKLIEAMRDPAFAALPDPVERYVVAMIERNAPGARVLYSHRRYSSAGEPVTAARDGAFLPFQKLAVATGLGALSDGGLVIHPIYGPWFALRAVILTVDDETAETDLEPSSPETISHAPIAKPCHCDVSCAAALAIARAGGDWRAWLAVRDACSLRDHRYSEAQIRYHYTKAWELEWGATSPIDAPVRGPDE